MSSIKISQLESTSTVGPNDSLPIARGTQETFRTPASQFITNASNIGTGPGELFSTKTSNTPTTLQFRTLSAVGENLAISTTTNTVVFEMSGQTPYKMSFLGDGSRTVWPLAPFNSVNAANYRVDIDGVLQEPFGDYSLSANQIIFTDAPYLSGKVVIVSSNVVRLNEAIVAPDSVETEMLRNGAVTPQKLSTGAPSWTPSGTTIVRALSTTGVSNLSSTVVTNLTATGNILTPNRPRFHVKYPATGSSNDAASFLPGTSNSLVTGWATPIITDGNFSNGLYTAPVTGLYWISFWITWSCPSGGSDFAISLNGTTGDVAVEPTVVVKPAAANQWTNGTITRLMFLNRNDTIGVITKYFVSETGSLRAEFSGVLVG